MLRTKIILLAVVGLLFASCSTMVPYTATNNPIGDKVGKSRTTLVFGAAGMGNLEAGISTNKKFGVIEAAKKGNIDKVATVDLKVTNFVIFQKVEIIVTGE